MTIDWQFAMTAVLVVGCAVYALRSLLPTRWWSGRPAAKSGACGGCSGCGDAAKPAANLAAGESVIRVVRQRPGSDVAG